MSSADKCVVCLCIYSRPVVLHPCGHSFCHDCWERVKQKWSINCPICDTKTSGAVDNIALKECLDDKYSQNNSHKERGNDNLASLSLAMNVAPKSEGMQERQILRILQYRGIGDRTYYHVLWADGSKDWQHCKSVPKEVRKSFSRLLARERQRAFRERKRAAKERELRRKSRETSRDEKDNDSYPGPSRGR